MINVTMGANINKDAVSVAPISLSARINEIAHPVQNNPLRMAKKGNEKGVE